MKIIHRILGRWFKWRQLWPNPHKVHKKSKYYPGTRFLKGPFCYRYACAGEDLKIGTLVEADLAGRIAPPPTFETGQLQNQLTGVVPLRKLLPPNTMEITAELIWGNVKAAKEVDQHGINVLGWPIVKVKKGQHFWIQEPPLRAEFKKEDDKSE